MPSRGTWTGALAKRRVGESTSAAKKPRSRPRQQHRWLLWRHRRMMFRPMITASILKSCRHGAPRQRRLDERRCRCRLRSHMVLLIQMRSRRGGQTDIAEPLLGFTSSEIEMCSANRPRGGSSQGPIRQGTMATTGHKVTAWVSRPHLRSSMRVIFCRLDLSCLFRFKRGSRDRHDLCSLRFSGSGTTSAHGAFACRQHHACPRV